VQDWNELLDLPVPEIRHRLISRHEDIARLRLSSPFVLAKGIDFEDEALRRRVWRAAKRIAVRSMTGDHSHYRDDGLTPERSLVRTVEDLIETVKAIARQFQSDEVFIIGSQSILLSWPDAPCSR
jgi:hypothetical protein